MNELMQINVDKAIKMIVYIRWRANLKYAQYASRQHQIALTLISSVPCYGASLLQISRFCQEILNLRILPVSNR